MALSLSPFARASNPQTLKEHAPRVGLALFAQKPWPGGVSGQKGVTARVCNTMIRGTRGTTRGRCKKTYIKSQQMSGDEEGGGTILGGVDVEMPVRKRGGGVSRPDATRWLVVVSIRTPCE